MSNLEDVWGAGWRMRDDRYWYFLKNFGHPLQGRQGLPRPEGARATWRSVAFYTIVLAILIGSLFVLDWVRG